VSDALFPAAFLPPGPGSSPVFLGDAPGDGGTEVAFPFGVTPHGRVAGATWEAHVEQMIEQVLFTNPGERVNLPDFGCGVMRLVFADESDALVTATQFLVQGSLQRWLGELIVVSAVRVQAVDTTFSVAVVYTLRQTGVTRTATFNLPGGAG